MLFNNPFELLNIQNKSFILSVLSQMCLNLILTPICYLMTQWHTYKHDSNNNFVVMIQIIFIYKYIFIFMFPFIYIYIRMYNYVYRRI